MASALEAPPRLTPRLVPTPALVVVTLLLLALPVAAAARAFSARRTVEANSPAVWVRAEYPARITYKKNGQLVLMVTSDHGCADAYASVSPSWLSRFSGLSPAPEGDAFFLGTLATGETRRLAVELVAERSLLARGELVVWCSGAREVSIPLSTFVFP